jgi:phosphopantothenoylcysteine decarboxylase/phosphopantothenate--cysteine ligase
MTESACQFVTPLTFRTLTANPVTVDMFEEPGQWNVKHVALAQRADVFVIAPATANFLGKTVAGIADDMLTTTVMATRAPVVIAPAMNSGMYESPIVQRNIASLKALGYMFVGPESGRLACGDTGAGRMAAPERIVDFAMHALHGRGRPPLAGRRVLVNAGPTREPIDPVRYITNRSSGKMGYAIAGAAAARGAQVTLVSGPTNLPVPEGCALTPVETADEMYQACMTAAPDADIIIAAAAVADYRPARYSPGKIKKTADDLHIELVRTRDILAELGQTKGARVIVGFAAETDDLLANAQAKLASKNLDIIVANSVGGGHSPFGSDENTVALLRPGREPEGLPAMSKLALAHEILDRVASIIR